MTAHWEGEPPNLRKTRFVCVSDTHNASPAGNFKLPKGDVLIHAGDISNQGSWSELKKSVDWMEKADFEAKIVVAGNHDITLDPEFYREYGNYFHNQHPQDPDKCLELFRASDSIAFLNHESKTVRLISPTGPGTTFNVFGSPYSPTRGMWAFGYPPEKAAALWDQIPLDTDIIVTHTPPKLHCDESRGRGPAGCEILRQTLWRVRPLLSVCGHIHEARGSQRVRWDLSAPNIKYKEEATEFWQDPGKDNNKLSLVDLTMRGGSRLDNDGSRRVRNVTEDEAGPEAQSDSAIAFCLEGNGNTDYPVSFTASEMFHGSSISSLGTKPITETDVGPPSQASLLSPAILPRNAIARGFLGQGNVTLSGRCDLEALTGRLGRKETCIINAAIMASSWPHKGSGGKKFNKPIVVDVDLPVFRN